MGAVTSIAQIGNAKFLLGTDQSNVYEASVLPDTPRHPAEVKLDLWSTCHPGSIAAIAFPKGFSEVFATCSKNDIRVWHMRKRREVLRIQVPNLHCLCVEITPDGKTILSGWEDGKVKEIMKFIYV